MPLSSASTTSAHSSGLSCNSSTVNNSASILEPAFNAKALGDIKNILLEIRTFPTLSEQATQQEFGALRASITNRIERANATRLEYSCFASILMAQVILRFNYATKVLWNYQIAVRSSMTLKQLREFLAIREEMAGANWNSRNSAATMSSAGNLASQGERAEVSWGEASASIPDVSKRAKCENFLKNRIVHEF